MHSGQNLKLWPLQYWHALPRGSVMATNIENSQMSCFIYCISGVTCWTCNKTDNKACNDWAPNRPCPIGQYSVIFLWINNRDKVRFCSQHSNTPLLAHYGEVPLTYKIAVASQLEWNKYQITSVRLFLSRKSPKRLASSAFKSEFTGKPWTKLLACVTCFSWDSRHN
jgi:hypothetical protein